MQTILFPCEPFQPRTIDSSFEAERDAARAAGFDVHLVDHSRVMTGDVGAALGSVPESLGHAIYRGWMLTVEQYTAMYNQLRDRAVRLVNTPEAYATCHHLPANYALLEGHTPKSTWLPLAGPPTQEQLTQLAAPFGAGPVVIKDYVKSQKHYWDEACFIPDASDLDGVTRVVTRFLELQGDDLNVGLVMREFVPLQIVGVHPKSKMPLAAEFRIFWFDQTPLLVHRYWADLADYDGAVPIDALRPIAARVPSRFFTTDVAFLADGSWTIVELGDAQVSGLPSEAVAPAFYAGLVDLHSEA